MKKYSSYTVQTAWMEKYSANQNIRVIYSRHCSITCGLSSIRKCNITCLHGCQYNIYKI